MVLVSSRSSHYILSSRSKCIATVSRRAFSSCKLRRSYEDTVQNLRIGKHTRVIYQGFTGRVATTNAQDSLKYGTNIVGGVTPGKEGEHIGLPLLPDLRKAKEQLKPDATAVFVAAPHCGKAIEDAIEAEIPLIVAVAEHIPMHDILRVMDVLKTQSKSRLVGANAPGIIAPIGHCRIGFQPLPTFSPGHIGIVAKSGTLSYETVASITRAGLGQSLCIGMGGDIVAGTSLVDALKVFEQDPETEGIVLVGEIGGRAEVEAAEWIRDYHRREKQPKPMSAVLGGIHAPPGRIMGHAGAWTGRGERTTTEKLKLLQDVGVTLLDHPENFGQTMKTLLSKSSRDPKKIQQDAANQKRGYHTSTRRPLAELQHRRRAVHEQRRTLVLKPEQGPGVLEPHLSGIEGLSFSEDPAPEGSSYLSVTIDRSEHQPCLATAPTSKPAQLQHRLKRFPYPYLSGPSDTTIKHAIEHMQMDAAPPAAHAQAAALLSALATMYKSREAITLAFSISTTATGAIQVHKPSLHLQFDDSAFKSAKRQEDIFALRDKSTEVPEEVEAESHGIVYVRLADPAANIGTLVNGAGLAMNTIDALHLHNGRAANFLDTGGKATSETVKKSFELILRDERVKVILVNIFGGLTDGGMIAEGVLLAFKEVDMKGVPVVVRIRGTNEEIGQRVIAQSGLELEAFDGFGEAADRVVEIARERS